MKQKTRNILVTLQCFVQKDGKYLMLHRNKNKRIMPDVWMAPGGKREQNEGLFAATRREVKEETGLTIKHLRIKAVGSAYLEDIDQEIHLHIVFADYTKGKVKQNPEDGELVWITSEELAKLPNLLAEIKELMPDLFGNNEEIISYTAVYAKGNLLTSFSKENS